MSINEYNLYSNQHQCKKVHQCEVQEYSQPTISNNSDLLGTEDNVAGLHDGVLLLSMDVTQNKHLNIVQSEKHSANAYDKVMGFEDIGTKKSFPSSFSYSPLAKDPFQCWEMPPDTNVSEGDSPMLRVSERRNTRQSFCRAGIDSIALRRQSSVFHPSDDTILSNTVESILSETSLRMEHEDEVASSLLFADEDIKKRKALKKMRKKCNENKEEAPSTSAGDNVRKTYYDNGTSETGSTHILLIQRGNEKHASYQSGVQTPSSCISNISSPTASLSSSTAGTLRCSDGKQSNHSEMVSKPITSKSLKGLFFKKNILSKIQSTEDCVAKSHSGIQMNESSAKNGLCDTNTFTQTQQSLNRNPELPVKKAISSVSGKNIVVMKPNLTLWSKVVIIGNSGSGKTTIKACFTSSVLRSLPNVSPSMTSSSSKFHYSSTGSRTKLSVTVIDSGPVPLNCGVTSLYDSNCMYILTLSLAGVKQRSHPKKLVSFGPKMPPEVIIHDGDKDIIRSYVRSIAAVAPKNTSFCLVGIGTDMLSDSSPRAVEAVVSSLRSLLLIELNSITHCNIMFRGCYAVSCLDHKVIGESKSDGTMYISDMWNLLCETMIKDAMSNVGGVILEAPIGFGRGHDVITSAMGLVGEKVSTDRMSAFPSNPMPSKPYLEMMGTTIVARFISEAITNKAADMLAQVTYSGMFTVEDLKRSFNFKRLFSDKESFTTTLDGNFPFQMTGTTVTEVPGEVQLQMAANDSNVNIPAKSGLRHRSYLSDVEKCQIALLQATHRARIFVTRARNEFNFIFVPKTSLEKHFYSLGITSKAHCENLLNGLARENEITTFRSQPPGREDTVLFQPHILSRAIITLVHAVQYSSYPIAERRRIQPNIDHEEIDAADPNHRLSLLGQLNDSIIIALSSCISEYRNLPEDCAELFLYILVISDIVMVCRSADPVPGSGKSTVNNTKKHISNRVSKKPQRDIPCRFKGFGWRFVIPSFLRRPVPSIGLQAIGALLYLSLQPPCISAVARESECLLYSITQDRGLGGIEVLEKHISLHPYPPFLQYHLICQLATFVASPNCVFSNGVWLSHPSTGCRALIIFTQHDDNAASATNYIMSSNSKSTPNQKLQFLCGSEANGATMDIYVVGSVGGKLAVVSFMAKIMTYIKRAIQYKAPGICVRNDRGPKLLINAHSTSDYECIENFKKIAHLCGKKVILELDRLFSVTT